LNLAVSITNFRVEMLPGNSRSMTRKQGLTIVNTIPAADFGPEASHLAEGEVVTSRNTDVTWIRRVE
jgi:hypothetical protein